ncbi:MAG: exodeoxyribonuclease VII large subunit [Prevotella sp.]|nr:exodeoxyribonuclease VII large subunit [Prevotella sp.]
MNRTVLSLSELNALVKDAVEYTLPDAYWVRAEVASVHESRGHCYMELTETIDGNGRGGTLVAQARACCWAGTWMRLSPKFQSVTGERLHAGMSVLLCVSASFHVLYGFSWIVTDIDPTFTMGDMARRRQEIIRKLKADGVYDLNKQLHIPMFCKRIAVVSSATAAGYGDFVNQLENNDYGFKFETKLFPAVMQGEQLERSIIAALEEVYLEGQRDGNTDYAFDTVVIIRGGGSTTDLSGFDSLALAENIANYPLPVITGIGHTRDESVADLVACKALKTPTAVAAFLIDNLAQTAECIDNAATRMAKAVSTRMQTEQMRLDRIEQYISNAFAIRKEREERRIADYTSRMNVAIYRQLTHERNRVETITYRLPMLIKALIQGETHRLQMAEQRAEALNPVNILKRGYSITLHKGHAVKDASQLKKDDMVTVMFAEGKREMRVER